MGLNISIKKKIVFNGREYGSADEMPEKDQQIYLRAVAGFSIGGHAKTGAVGSTKIVVNGQQYESIEAMPPDLQAIYRTAMAAAGKPGDVAPHPAGQTCADDYDGSPVPEGAVDTYVDPALREPSQGYSFGAAEPFQFKRLLIAGSGLLLLLFLAILLAAVRSH
jgi:hypothetical protein